MAEMFIGGEPVELPGLERRTIANPATGEPVDTVPAGTPAEIDRAVQAAHAAFIPWWETSAARRGELVHAGARLVHEHIQELARLLTAEQGKPLREARLEIHRFVLTLEHYAGLAKNLRGAYVPNLDKDTYGLVTKRPLGVVGAIVPWNFPTTLLSNKLAPALVAGNTMVAKPADTTPLTTLRIAALLHEAGIPAGVFNVVTGRGSVVGEALVQHPLVRKIGFTGSTPVGEHVMALAAKGAKRLTLELGGSRPADHPQGRRPRPGGERGQRRALLQLRPGLPRGQARVRGRGGRATRSSSSSRQGEAARRRAGHQDGIFLGPLHSERQRAEIEEQLADARSRRGPASAARGSPATLRRRLVLRADADPRARRATPAWPRRRCFGPVLPIWRVKDLDEAIERANDSPFGLGSSVWTQTSTPRAGRPSACRPATPGSTRPSACSTSCRSAAGARAASARSTASRRSTTTRSPSRWW